MRAEPRSRQICLARKDNIQAVSRQMRNRSMQVDNRRLDGGAIGELNWDVDTSFALGDFICQLRR